MIKNILIQTLSIIVALSLVILTSARSDNTAQNPFVSECLTTGDYNVLVKCIENGEVEGWMTPAIRNALVERIKHPEVHSEYYSLGLEVGSSKSLIMGYQKNPTFSWKKTIVNFEYRKLWSSVNYLTDQSSTTPRLLYCTSPTNWTWNYPLFPRVCTKVLS